MIKFCSLQLKVNIDGIFYLGRTKMGLYFVLNRDIPLWIFFVDSGI
jgi:hypothetical protein